MGSSVDRWKGVENCALGRPPFLTSHRVPVIVVLILGLVLSSTASCRGREGEGGSGAASVAAAAAQSEKAVPGQVPAVLVSPAVVRVGGPLRVLTAFERPAGKIAIEVEGPDGVLKQVKELSAGGPPYWKAAHFRPSSAGAYRIDIKYAGTVVRSLNVEVVAAGSGSGKISPSSLWTGRGWGREAENLYSAWFEAMFMESEEGASWDSLNKVTENAEANLLHDHLGADEDDAGRPTSLRMEPDCADAPFFMRAYFSWKLGLPFGFHECGWGGVSYAPKPGRWITFAGAESGDRVRSFRRMLPVIMNAVHAGNGRAALSDSSSDYYPLALDRRALRPGTVYADPYGHTLVIAHWVPQTRKSSGKLLAVDAQPDNTIGVKRFWKGNFLFETKGVVGQPGFKWFRPIAVENGRMRLLSNADIKGSPDYGDLSLEQGGMAAETFYDRMETLIDPEPLDADRAMRDLVGALQEQLMVRVDSVSNGEKYMQAHPGTVIPMPSSAPGLFQAQGAWEDYSTPNRDLRVLIAIEAVLRFPEKVSRDPGRYEMPRGRSPEEIKSRLESELDKLTREKSITYTRSDGSSWKLTLAEIIGRRDALEMTYNPNDSVELRWGAPDGSEEMRTARRRVPANQKARMESFRSWFHKRLHPPT